MLGWLFSLYLIASCAVNPVTGEKQFMLMSESQEVQMGASYDPQVMSTFGEYKSDAMLNFIQARATTMGTISHRPGLKYHVRILDTPVVNAFAVPGGYIYFTRGILAQFNNEAELIGVLGHEMGHITARHSVSQQSKQQLGQFLLVGGMIAAPKYAHYAGYAMEGMQLLFLKFSRDDERQADALGVEYSSKIGYDAHKMADFFQVLQKMSLAEGHAGVPSFFSTHPDPGDRYNAVNRQAANWQDSLKLPSWQINAESYLKMIDGLVFGDDPRQGFVEGNTFYHPSMKFKYNIPAGWDVENSPAQVNMAPKDDKALMVFMAATGKTLDEASQNTINQLKLTLIEKKNITVNKMPALAVSSKQVNTDQSTGAQTNILILSYFIQHEGLVLAFHSVAGENDFPAYSGTFTDAMSSFSVLTDPSKLNIKPKRIYVKKVQRAGTLADAFTYYGIKPEQRKNLALLNNLELTSKVQAGQLIKIIGE
jgi:predicted Zn-dependent protease